VDYRWITDGMRSGWRTLRNSVLSSPTSAPTILKWPCQEQCRSDFTASEPCFRRFRSCFHKWGIAPFAACEDGAEEQTVDHAVLQCPSHQPPYGPHGLTVLGDETIELLLSPARRSRAAWQCFTRTGSR